MHNLLSKYRVSLACVSFVALVSIACGDDSKDEAGEADGSGTAESGESGGAPETSGSSMEGDGDGDGGDGDGDAGDGDGDGGDGDGDAGDGDGDAGDGDGDPMPSTCPDYETQEACEADSACQALFGQPVQENGPDAPCLDVSEYVGCIEMMVCDDALTWFCVGGNAKPMLMSSGCGPDGAEMCDPMLPDLVECP